MVRNKDPNNYIKLILSSLQLAKNFHQKVRFAITEKFVLHCYSFKFYIRRRYQKVFLYTRIKAIKASTIKGINEFITNLKILLPETTIESTRGHLKGLVLNSDDTETLTKLLALISVLSKPQDFYKKETTIYTSFYNYIASSPIPIHIRFTNKQIAQLTDNDIINLLLNEVKVYDNKRDKNVSTNNTNDNCNNVSNNTDSVQ